MKFRAAFVALSSLCAALALLTAFPLSALGIYQDSYHARYGGLAGVNLAIGGTPLDLASNPANLTLLKEIQLDVGAAFAHVTGEYRDEFRDPDPSRAYANDITTRTFAPLPYIGFAAPITRNLVYGAALYVPGGARVNLRGVQRLSTDGSNVNQWSGLNIPFTGESARIQENTEGTLFAVKLTNGLAWKIGSVSLGVGLEAVYGRQRTSLKYFDASGRLEIPGRGFDYKSDPAYALGGIAGITWAVPDSLRVAYSYQARNKLNLDGRMNIDVGNAEIFRGTGVSYTFRLPERHSLGISYRAGDFVYGLDAAYIKWKWTGTLKQVLEDAWFPTPAGRTNLVVGNLNLQDQVSARMGVEYDAGGTALRAGFGVAQTAATPEGLIPLAGAVLLERIIGLGAGFRFGRYQLDLAYNHLFRNRLGGANTSDWDLQHAIFSAAPADIRVLDFDHQSAVHTHALVVNLSMRF